MSKDDFLRELEEALRESVSPSLVNENIRYYDDYIETEKRKGRSEDEVMDELGDPRLIAKTIVDTSDSRDRRGLDSTGNTYEGGREEDFENRTAGRIKYTRVQGWKVLAVLAAVLILFFLVFTVALFLVGSFIMAFWPAIIAVAVIWWILNPLRFD